MKKNELYEIRDKIHQGLKDSFKQLIEDKMKKNEELVFSENGKIFKIKAKTLYKRMEH